MAVSEDKCIQCPSRYRPADLDTSVSPAGMLDADGGFMGLPYWFCSIKCYKKAIRNFLDPRYDFDKQATDDEECVERMKEAVIDYYVKARATGGLLSSLFNRVAWQSENDYTRPEKEAAIAAFEDRKVGEITGAEIELHKRLHAEWIHAMEEEINEREKEEAKQEQQARKDEAKRAEQAQKDAERQRKIDEAEEAREAEEERWRPRPFEL